MKSRTVTLCIMLWGILALGLAQDQEKPWEQRIEKDGKSITFKLAADSAKGAEAVALCNRLVDVFKNHYEIGGNKLECNLAITWSVVFNPTYVQIRSRIDRILDKDEAPVAPTETIDGLLLLPETQAEKDKRVEQLVSRLLTLFTCKVSKDR